MIFQSYALWPHMTAFQNVAYPLQSRRLKKREIAERVERVFELVGIPELQRQYPGQMSGGQQQRVALARALAGDADLILFDEPLSNVDAKVREQLRFELLSMQRELGFAAVYVTHDQAEAMELAHRVAVMREGQVAQVGLAAGDLPRARVALRRRLRRLVERARTGRLRSVDGGVAVVETDLGEVRGVAADGVAAGRRGSSRSAGPSGRASRREEPASPNRWRGEVRAAAFLGASLEHVVRVGEHTFRLWSVDTRLLEPGTEVWLYVEPEHVRVLPDERLRPARAGDVRQLPREFAELRATLPGRAQRRLERLLGADALRRRRRCRCATRPLHDDGAERRPEARVHRPAAAAPPRPAGAHAVPRAR